MAAPTFVFEVATYISRWGRSDYTPRYIQLARDHFRSDPESWDEHSRMIDLFEQCRIVDLLVFELQAICLGSAFISVENCKAYDEKAVQILETGILGIVHDTLEAQAAHIRGCMLPRVDTNVFQTTVEMRDCHNANEFHTLIGKMSELAQLQHHLESVELCEISRAIVKVRNLEGALQSFHAQYQLCIAQDPPPISSIHPLPALLLGFWENHHVDLPGKWAEKIRSLSRREIRRDIIIA